ncbi:MAG: TolC family protein [Verrucomicrobiota bacterium]
MAAAESPERTPVELSLKDFLQRVLDNNENLQTRLLEAEINRKRYEGERGIFEPEFVGSVERVDRQRENTEEQQRNLFGLIAGRSVFNERNNLYSSGIETLVPTGGKVRLGYNVRDLHNNLNSINFPDGEWESNLGLSLTHPLLKGLGVNTTMAGIRLAALNSDVSFQEYRQAMMELVSGAEVTYWDIFLAQEQFTISQESVKLAETILSDNKARVQVGKASELEVLQAEAGLAARRSLEKTAHQKLLEAVNRAASLFSHSVVDTNIMIKAVDAPQVRDVALDYANNYQQAFDLNPEYLIRRKRADMEGVRVAYAKNQRLPQVDLKASYGLNGLGDSPQASWNDIEQHKSAFWSVGIELRIPLSGGIKSRKEYEAAKLRQKQALLGIKGVEVQLANALDSAINKVRTYGSTVEGNRKVVEFNQKVLETRLAQLDVGKTDSRTVLETEEDLFEAKISHVDSLVQYQRALLEFELVKGAVLKARNLDFSRDELSDRTERLVTSGKIQDEDYRNYLKKLQKESEKKGERIQPVEDEGDARWFREKRMEMEAERARSTNQPKQ